MLPTDPHNADGVEDLHGVVDASMSFRWKLLQEEGLGPDESVAVNARSLAGLEDLEHFGKGARAGVELISRFRRGCQLGGTLEAWRVHQAIAVNRVPRHGEVVERRWQTVWRR